MKIFQKKLLQLKDKNRFRSLSLPAGVDLTSNDYLGLAAHDVLRQAAIDFFQNGGDIGAGGSRLLRGHTQAHADLEEFAAAYFFASKCLYFSSGFQANTTLFQTLCSRHDTIIFDEYVHASAREGIQNSHAQHKRVKHNDAEAFESAIQDVKTQQKTDGVIWMVVESVYSMDGDIAPLDALYELAETYDAILVIDEAHGTGVCGMNGKGVSEEIIKVHGYERIITLHTCGKAIGVAGGLICASEEVVDMMVNAARGFIYSTAPMPVQAHLVRKSLELISSDEGRMRRDQLSTLCKKAQQLFASYGGDAGTHIVPIILGDDEMAVNVAQKLQQKGYDVRAIRPPTVPEGTARLRLSLSADLEDSVLDKFAADLDAAYQRKAA